MESSETRDRKRTSKRPVDDDDDDRPRRREGRDSEAPRKKRRVQEEPTPVVSARFLTAAVIVLGLTVLPMSTFGSLFEPKDPTVPTPNTWTVGSKATIAI